MIAAGDIWKLAYQGWNREHRAPRIRLGRRYLPGRRGAYGRREGSAPLVEQARQLTAEDLTNCSIRSEPHTLGHGGQVALYRCPQCERRRRALYLVEPGVIQCRSCAGLHYASEYQGRALEADPARWDAALQAAIALPTTSRRRAATRERRLQRATRALAVDMARQTAWRQRYTRAWERYFADDRIWALRMELRLARMDLADARRARATARREELEAQIIDLRTRLADAKRQRQLLERQAA